jgi:hypothetical protein
VTAAEASAAAGGNTGAVGDGECLACRAVLAAVLRQDDRASCAGAQDPPSTPAGRPLVESTMIRKDRRLAVL